MAAQVERQASGILYAARRPMQLAERTGYVAARPRSHARAVSGRSDCEHGVAADLQHRCPQPHLPASGHVARRPFERKEKLTEHQVRRREAADQASDDRPVVSSGAPRADRAAARGRPRRRTGLRRQRPPSSSATTATRCAWSSPRTPTTSPNRRRCGWPIHRGTEPPSTATACGRSWPSTAYGRSDSLAERGLVCHALPPTEAGRAAVHGGAAS